MASSRKKSRKGSSSRRHDAPADEWKQFTSPDGHPYYYNAATKESRWEPPAAEGIGHRRGNHGLNEEDSLQEEVEPLKQESVPKIGKKERLETSSKSVAGEPRANAAAKPKNAMFQKLQASLEGRIGGPMLMGMRGPPPMLKIRHEEAEANHSAQEETQTPSVDEQYEAETAGMSAAERLRFLRRKRQENMMAKRESVSGDDFMAEVANNMKKKGVTVKPKETEANGNARDKRPSWREQEQAEEERKRLQMQAETAAKQQEEARKERERQAAREREQQREQEKERHKTQTGNDPDAGRDRGSMEDATDPDVPIRASSSGSSAAPAEEDLEASSPERVEHRSRSRSRGGKDGNSTFSNGREAIQQAESAEDEHPPVEDGHSAETAAVTDSAQDEEERAREERRGREKELAAAKPSSVTSESPQRKSMSRLSGLNEESTTRSTSSIEAEEEAKAREKQLRRERRRMAKMEAALAALSLESNGGQGDVHPEQTRHERSEKQPDSSNGSAAGSAQAGGYLMNGQPLPGQPLPGQPPFSGGMYPPYPYMMMPPPPPSPYGYYYPYMQPPPMQMPMYPPGMVPPGYQLMPPTPPPSADGITMPSALVPYGADSTLANAYGMNFGGMYGQQFAPELSRCDCCKGIGVGLVEKNGVCAHCNRLRLAFIVDSAQMRQRCSVCGGWGLQLLQANGTCEHCTRQKSQAKLMTEAAARRRSVAVPATAAVTVAAPPRRNSAGNPSKTDGLDEIDWDKSDDDSEWDD
ncbi:hypothetical protein PHYPSEUDO_010349 [Phytophthora pseudosyringae]|uniref:WW domain-containing protein n=1 Tax=Phytophthora pseudosyringae TaxID=221518 RepID=A0A8T1WB17_9STRA|nr:hypothetical protein PHYPSEUDO_010349 [Phytophthora pseudosyringae]